MGNAAAVSTFLVCAPVDSLKIKSTLVAASTGLRRGEVLALRSRDVDFTASTLQATRAKEVVGGKVGINAQD